MNSKSPHCTVCHGTGRDPVTRKSCRMCGTTFSIRSGETQIEASIEGASATEVTKVVRSILELANAANEQQASDKRDDAQEDLRRIAANIETGQCSENDQFVEAVNQIAIAICSNNEITFESRTECLHSLARLVEEANKQPEERENRSSIRKLLGTLATTCSATGGLSSTWTTWGQYISSIFV